MLNHASVCLSPQLIRKAPGWVVSGRSHVRCRSAADRLLRLWVRIPPVAWMSVCRECCVLSGRGPCDGLITRPEESYRLRCVIVCDLETSRVRKTWPTGWAVAPKTKSNIFYSFCIFCMTSKLGPVLVCFVYNVCYFCVFWASFIIGPVMLN